MTPTTKLYIIKITALSNFKFYWKQLDTALKANDRSQAWDAFEALQSHIAYLNIIYDLDNNPPKIRLWECAFNRLMGRKANQSK